MSNQNGLPKHWRVATINEAISDDGVFVDGDWIESKDQDPNGDVRLIQLADIGDGSFKDKSARFLTLQRAKELNCTFLKEGDVLVARMPDPIGRACIFPLKSENKYVTAVDVAIIRSGTNAVSNKFLMYAINNPQIRNEIEGLQSGTTRKRISRKNLETIMFPLPPLAEQQRIVVKLEELFSELDAGLASLKTAARQLKTYRQAVLKWAFEGKLTNEHVNEGELPAGWKWVKFGELMESVRNGYSKKPDDKGSFPILRISSVRPFKIDLSDRRFLENPLDEINSVAENDLLFTRYNGSRDFVGVCARVPALKETVFYPDKLIRCRPAIKAAAHSTYLQYAANTGLSRQFVLSRIKTTAGQTGISGEEIKSIPIPLCSLEEQHRIVQEIESRLSVCDKLEEMLAASLGQAEALRQSILKQAFAGKLVAPILNLDGIPA